MPHSLSSLQGLRLSEREDDFGKLPAYGQSSNNGGKELADLPEHTICFKAPLFRKKSVKGLGLRFRDEALGFSGLGVLQNPRSSSLNPNTRH